MILRLSLLFLFWAFIAPAAPGAPKTTFVLNPDSHRHYIEAFNRSDALNRNALQRANYIDDAAAWTWLRQNIPFFESSAKDIEEIYYFRWWTYRKHIKETPSGFVLTEFLSDVPWAGMYNTISCAAGHHFYEGRWLRDTHYLDDYARFWFRKGGEPRRYSFWAADAIHARALVTGDKQLAIDLLQDLAANYRAWEKTNLDATGLFHQIDDRDGMEFSIGGSGYRPTINSYMYGDAMALADIAKWAGNSGIEQEFAAKAAKLRASVEERLWDPASGFYKTVPLGNNFKPVAVRELVGYVPWYFDLPHPGREEAWKQLMDSRGFYTPHGLTTAEQRDPRFMFSNRHECLWNGPIWPFATSQTLVALANLLNDYQQSFVSKKDYFELLRDYARSQHLTVDGKGRIPFIDEDLDPQTGDWLVRRQLYQMTTVEQGANGGKDRGRDYNHSTFNDLVISGMVGLRARVDKIVEINPQIPDGVLDYFCLDGVHYHDVNLTILYDRTGNHYQKGSGLRVFADGVEIGLVPTLGRLTAALPQERSRLGSTRSTSN